MPSSPAELRKDLEAKLAADNVRANLVRAGLFLTAWELLKQNIVGEVRDFFLIGFDQHGELLSSGYQKVLDRNSSRFVASVMWLVDQGALTAEQGQLARELRNYRNTVAHELPAILLELGKDIPIERIHQANELIVALGSFWGRMVVDTDPEFDATGVADADIRSGSMVLMQHLLAVAEAELLTGGSEATDAAEPGGVDGD